MVFEGKGESHFHSGTRIGVRQFRYGQVGEILGDPPNLRRFPPCHPRPRSASQSGNDEQGDSVNVKIPGRGSGAPRAHLVTALCLDARSVEIPAGSLGPTSLHLSLVLSPAVTVEKSPETWLLKVTQIRPHKSLEA